MKADWIKWKRKKCFADLMGHGQEKEESLQKVGPDSPIMNLLLHLILIGNIDVIYITLLNRLVVFYSIHLHPRLHPKIIPLSTLHSWADVTSRDII